MDSAQVHYNGAPVTQTRINTGQNQTLALGTPFAVPAGDIQWTVEDADLLTITPSGDRKTAVIQGRGVGITTVTLTVWGLVSVSCKVTVGTTMEHAEQVHIYRDMIQQYKKLYSQAFKQGM